VKYLGAVAVQHGRPECGVITNADKKAKKGQKKGQKKARYREVAGQIPMFSERLEETVPI
jgi:hypothetical protein